MCCDNNKIDIFTTADCKDPPILEHTTLELAGRLEGSTTKYKCETGSVLEGTPETICKEDGTWSKPTFKCRGQ